MNYLDAKAQCESDGVYLATPRSDDQNAFLSSLIPNENIWIGLNDIDEEGTFVSVDDKEVSYTNWYTGEPNDSGNEDGVAILGVSSNKYWNDKPITMRLKFVCISSILFDNSSK